MLNIDDRLLSCGISADQLFLLLHISKYVSEDLTCFPGNAALCSSTGWSLSKMNEIKKSLIVDGYLKREERYINDRQTSNTYTIQTSFIASWKPPTNLKDKGGIEGKLGYLKSGTHLPEIKQGDTSNPTTEVLSNEVLTFDAVVTPEQKLKKWTDEIRQNPKTKNAYTRGRGLKIENFESDFDKWLAEAEAAPEKYEDRASVVKHFLNHACQSDEKRKKPYAGPSHQPQYPAKKSHRPEINENYLPKEKQLW